MDAVIYNSSDLKEEIERLKVSKKIQEEVLKSHFNSPAAIFHTVTSLFKHSPTAASQPNAGLFGGHDIVTLISRFALPFILNKTLFRGSNFIIKALVGLASQKASGFINEKNVASVWDKIKSFIPNMVQKNRSTRSVVAYDTPRNIQRY